MPDISASSTSGYWPSAALTSLDGDDEDGPREANEGSGAPTALICGCYAPQISWGGLISSPKDEKSAGGPLLICLSANQNCRGFTHSVRFAVFELRMQLGRSS